VEAAKLCWSERRQTLGDPEMVKVPIEQLLSKQAAANRAQRIRGNTKPRSTGREPPGGNHTANIIAIDRERNLVSLTATQGDTWGSRVAIDGLGLVLGHGMSRFTYPDQEARSPNAPAPGKRVQHNMCPVVMLKGGKPFGTLGLPGGPKIVTVTAQLIASVVDFAAAPGEAVDAPRVHTEGDEPILCSASVPAETSAELELMGHKVRRNQVVGGLANVGLLEASGKEIAIAGNRGPEAVAAI
jgi:gamma-glutamyltranspeptidase/glutathione hydrolase